MKKFLKISTAILIGSLISLFAVELLTRLFLPKPDKHIALLRMRAPDLQMDQHTDLKNPGYNPFIQRRPYSEWICDGKNQEKMNNEGFRDRDFSIQAPPGKIRIAAIGDSFTEGWMGPRETSFPKALEKKLPSVEVLNFGMANRSPLRYVTLYDQVVRKYHPQVVIVFLYRNDLGEDDGLRDYVTLDSRGVPNHFEYEKYFRRMPRMPQTKWEKRRDKWQWYLCEHSYFYPYAAVALTVDPDFRRKNLEAPSNKDLAQLWKYTREHLLTLEKLVKEDKAKLMIAYVPDLGDFSDPNPFQKFAGEFAKEQSIPYFDGSQLLKSQSPESLYIPNDGHFSEKGHEKYAVLLADWLKKASKTLH